MKKFGILAAFTVMLLSGCSVDIDTGTSKVEGFANVAEELGDTITNAKSELGPLQEKKVLTAKDQQAVVDHINRVTDVIHDFKEEESTFLAIMVKKAAGKELNNKEEVLLTIKEKAEKNEATEEDIKKMIETLSSDYEIKLLK
jgi:hypothetical protein